MKKILCFTSKFRQGQVTLNIGTFLFGLSHIYLKQLTYGVSSNKNFWGFNGDLVRGAFTDSVSPAGTGLKMSPSFNNTATVSWAVFTS